EIGDALIRLFSTLRLFVDPIVDTINRHRLKGYVRDEIERRFADRPDVVDELKKRFHIDAGLFGYRITCSVHRMFVDSRTRTERYADVPNLLGLHRDGLIDLFALAGFTSRCDIWSKEGWYRPRPQRA